MIAALRQSDLYNFPLALMPTIGIADVGRIPRGNVAAPAEMIINVFDLNFFDLPLDQSMCVCLPTNLSFAKNYDISL